MEWALHQPRLLDPLRRREQRHAARRCCSRITGLWAALEGSILLWARDPRRLPHVRRAASSAAAPTDPLVAVATITGLVVALFFFALMLGPGEPVQDAGHRARSTAAGPTRCCRTTSSWRSTRRCSTSGYVGFTVPFMFAIAALVTGRFGEGWLADTRRATLVAWGFLTVGIILGAWWSYEVLGWGGFWAWDPVENASLLPWLTGTAFIHSVIVQERRGMLRVWNLSLVIATFCLTILGTFLTRSGVIDSVHAFTAVRHRSVAARVPRRSSPRPASGSSRGAATSCARRAASTPRCRASRRSSPTTCCSRRSRSSCCSAPCSR